MRFVPRKLYYKIREACEIVGVEAHVLRYWETEFPSLSPPKSKSGQRTYRPRDIELLLEIRKLLYEEGFTIAGARRRLSSRKQAADHDEPAAGKPFSDDKAADAPARPAAPGGANGLPEPVAPSKSTEVPAESAGSKAEAASKPSSERLRKVQAELENILTLLDRE
jgi:DNA-binding transcriptional MerR regulator